MTYLMTYLLVTRAKVPDIRHVAVKPASTIMVMVSKLICCLLCIHSIMILK